MKLPVRITSESDAQSLLERIRRDTLQQSVSKVQEAVVLLMDSSASMSTRDCDKKTTRISAACNAAMRFVSSCDSGISLVGVAFFSDELVRLVKPTSDYPRLYASLGEFTAYGNTYMYTYIVEMCGVLSEFKVPLRRIILMTDGLSNDRQFSEEDAIRAARSSSVVIDCIAFGDDADLEALRRLSTATGGVCKEVPLLAESLAKAYQQLEVRARHLLTGGK